MSTTDNANFPSEMKSAIREYIIKEIVSGRYSTPIDYDTSLLVQDILDSLSLVKLVMFLESKFSLVVKPEELVPENFSTINAICAYIMSKKGTPNKGSLS
jgi:acyl carrier protein